MNRLRGQRGQTAVEFALCATVFFMIVFGLLKVATIYGDYVALQHAARDGSRKGSVTRGTGNANAASVGA
ncbi:MAG TPA: TadE family protein, partial [Gaiellales bacterium]|nr:TadE family protein [Gaiellales bacterium]